MASSIAAEGAPLVARGDPDRLELAGKLATAVRIRAAAEQFMAECPSGGAPGKGRDAASRLVETCRRKLAGAYGGAPGMLICGTGHAQGRPPDSFMHEPILDMSGRHLSEMYMDVRRLDEGAGGQ